uniref:Zinc finger protein 384 a n=1 Tax=Cynoglossus semilaevis TaxID=244447 RepID=A0A3P8WT05_CYNSE
MDDSHFNSSYFWSPVPTVQGQIENAMFLNKAKEQLGPEKANVPSFPHPSMSSTSSPHYPSAILALPGSMEGGAGNSTVGGHLHQCHTSQNVTVVPVPSTGIMTGTLVPTSSTQSFAAGHPTQDHAAPPAVVMPTPSKRGRKSKQMMGRVGAVGGVLPPGSDALILAHLAAGGQHHAADPYDLKSDMQIHAKSHTEAKPHKCPHCSKSFANSSYLSQHIRIHSGAKPYTCTYCQKTFRQLSHLYLSQHIRIHTGAKIHTGDRPYKCNHPGCEKAFTQLSNLQSHRRQHNKDKPFKCHNCNRGYTDAASLEVHLSTHTVKHAKLFSCALCNRSYTSETYLMKHMRKHNPDPLTTNPNSTSQNPNAGPPGSYQPPQQPSEAVVPCPFDLHQYKTVATGEIQYKPVSVADLPVVHKDLCLTVSTSAIQVEHMNS